MFGDRERLERQRAEQDRAVATLLRQEVIPYSRFHRDRLSGSTVGSVADLARLPTMSLEDVGDPASLVLRPTAEQIAAAGSFDLKSRLFVAKLANKVGALNRSVIDPLYKPVHWVMAESIPIAYSARDLDRLAEIGRRWLEAAGVQVADTIVSLLPPGAHLAYWQLLLGARVGGLSAIGLDPRTSSADVVALQPTVLAGSMAGLARLAGEGAPPMPEVRTIIAVGDPVDPRLAAIRQLSGRRDVAVVTAYAPPGVRALWAQCRGGTGLHTWPATEIIELDPSPHGEIVWTGIGWYGSAFVRLRTGVAGTLVEGMCPACGRTTARLVELRAASRHDEAPAPAARPAVEPPPPEEDEDWPDFVEVLGGHPDVAAWQVEMRTVGDEDELIVYLAPVIDGHPGRLVRALDQQLAATQYVVLDGSTVEQRIARHGGEQILDLRT